MIHLKKRDISRYLAQYLLFAPFFFGLFMDFLGLPGALRYTLDLAWCGLAGLAVHRGKLRFSRSLSSMVWTVVMFFLYTLILLVFRYRSEAWYLWGLRNNFRFYIAFFAFACLLSREDAQHCFRALEVLFWINIVLSLVQFFCLGIRQDYLGGIFGVERGRNGTYTLLFFLLMLSRSLLAMMNGAERMGPCLAKCGAALLVAALAEMFGFFLLFSLTVMLAAVLTRFSRRKCLLLLVLGVVLLLSSNLLLRLFGEGSKLTLDVIRNRLFAPHYATDDDLGRLTAIPTLARTILQEPHQRLFGLGLGNCDTSTVAAFCSDFARQYAHLHYTWFLSAFLFLETGYTGLFLYLLFFVVCLVQAAKRKKRGGDLLYCQMGMILPVLCMILTVYNSALRAEGGYLMYFGLALPFLRPSGKEADDEGKSGSS